jgi:hypothetical protein
MTGTFVKLAVWYAVWRWHYRVILEAAGEGLMAGIAELVLGLLLVAALVLVASGVLLRFYIRWPRRASRQAPGPDAA